MYEHYDVIGGPSLRRGPVLRWHARYCGDLPDVGFEEAHAVLACLAGLAGLRPKLRRVRWPSSSTARTRAGE